MMAVVFKGVGTMVARMAGNDEEMDRVARLVLFTAKNRARRHQLTGEYIGQLTAKNVPGKKGVRDRMIFAGDKAAYSIEWGHWAPRKGAPGATWVPGQHILGGAVFEIPGSWVKGKF